MGTSGQNIDDVRKYSDKESTLDMMESMLQWAHIAPTAPDTLNCYPFQNGDPFVVKKQPHVFFAGNQEKFEAKLVTGNEGQKTLLVSVPSSDLDPVVVLLNLKSLSCHPVYFNINNEWI